MHCLLSCDIGGSQKARSSQVWCMFLLNELKKTRIFKIQGLFGLVILCPIASMGRTVYLPTFTIHFTFERTTIHVGTYTSPHSWYMCLTLAKTPSKRNPCDFSPRFGETCWEFKGVANLMPWNNSHLGSARGWCQVRSLGILYLPI